MVKAPPKSWLFAAVLLAIGQVGPMAEAAELLAFTEDTPPYAFEKDGAPSGIATEILQAVCREGGVTCRIEMVPWARPYREALMHPNCMAFFTTRTPDRESAFLWIGPILTRHAYFYGLRDSPLHLNRIHELNGLRVGVVTGDYAIEKLKRDGVKAEYLETAPTSLSNTQKLLAGRIDVFPAIDMTMAWTLRSLGRSLDTVRPVLPNSVANEVYFAINPGSDPELVAALRRGWEKVAATSLTREVVGRYLPGFDLDTAAR